MRVAFAASERGYIHLRKMLVRGFDLSKIKFGARLSRLVVIQSQETAKGTVLTGVTREGTEPYNRYAQLTPLDRLRWSYVRDATLECERLGYWSVVLPYHVRMEGGAEI